MGASSAMTPATSLSAIAPRMSVAFSAPYISRHVCASCRAAWGLCAPSRMMRPSSMRWNRPGHSTTCSALVMLCGVGRRPVEMTAANATAAFMRWWLPGSVIGQSAMGLLTKFTAQPRRAQVSRMTASASGVWGDEMTGTPGLMMPAFSPAISASVVPRYFVWSRPMGVMTLTAGVTILVASSRPPRPVSSTTQSAVCC